MSGSISDSTIQTGIIKGPGKIGERKWTPPSPGDLRLVEAYAKDFAEKKRMENTARTIEQGKPEVKTLT